MSCLCVNGFVQRCRRGGGGGGGVPISYFATATGRGMIRSVYSCFGRALSVSLILCTSATSEAGLHCSIVRTRGSGRGCLGLEKLVTRFSYPAVVCTSQAGHAVSLTAGLSHGNCGTLPFGKGVTPSRGGTGRSTFVGSRMHVVITASTFKVKMSGGSIKLIVRCSVSSSLRGCIRRTNETKHSPDLSTEYCILCDSDSLSGRFVLLGRAGLDVDRVRRM